MTTFDARSGKAAVVQGERAYELGQKVGDGFTPEPGLKKALADWKRRP
jgi:hypothetical protein